VAERRVMIKPQDAQLSVARQCELVGLPRSSFYYQPVAPDAFTLEVMHAIDRIYTKRPFFGVRRIWKTLRDDGYLVNPKRVHRLMQQMGLQAIYPRKRLSLSDPAHRVFPYLLREVTVDRPDQAWCSDITYLRLRGGFVYLVAVMTGSVATCSPGASPTPWMRPSAWRRWKTLWSTARRTSSTPIRAPSSPATISPHVSRPPTFA